MMVDLGGGARERFQNVSAEEPEEALPPISSVGFAHHGSRSASWRSTFQEQDTSSRLTLVESVPHSIIQVKSDPENLSGLCIGNSNSLSETPVSSAEAAEDARVKGQLLQEITHVAEAFEPYSSSSLPPGCYRNYTLSTDAPTHTDYIFADTPHWCWSRSSTDDKNLSGHNGGSLFTGGGPSNETVINSLQYNVPPHLMSDAFSSPLPPVSVNQSPTSVPTCSPIQRPPPPPPSALTSSALDLSPSLPSTTHQLPSLQPSLMTPASTHMTLSSAHPSTHQLPNLPSSLITLDIPSQALSTHDTLDNTLDLVGVEEAGSHERTPEFECGECGAVFSRLPHLKYHMKVHGEEMEKSCDKQEFTTDSSNSKLRVQSPEKVFPCKHCGEKFSRAEKLKTHELKHSGDRPFRCNDCGTAFPAKAMLVRHKKVHTGEKPHKCDICKTCFTEAGSLKVHKRLHSGEKPFKCDQCDVAFSGAGMLATHKRKHTGERPYMCDECGETFRLLSTLKSHRRRHTGEKPFVCELCGSSFTQRAAMQRHKRIHSDQKPWECEQCGYKFREKENLRKHIALHKIKLQHMCDICGAGFNQAKKLETHKMLHNGGDRPYKCNKCPSTFTNPKYLTQHKKRVHDRKGAIRCEECNGTFKRKETLRSHMRIHKGERPYVCEECGAAFNQRGTLTKHIRVHGNQALTNSQGKNFETKSFDRGRADTGGRTPAAKEDEEAAFNCSVCDLRFSSQRELLRHSRSSHPSIKNLQENTASDQDVDDSSEHIRDKYICEDCNQTFFRRRQLKAHKKNCPCRCPTYQVDPLEKEEVTTVQSDTREVDAMKLLTAVLAATSNTTGEVSDFHNSSSSNENPSSIPTISLHSSSSAIASNVEEHHDRHESLRLFSACDPSYAEHLHIDFKDSHLDHSPQPPSHLPQSPQPPDSILHQTSQGHHQLDHSHLSLEHISQDHVQHSSHIQSSDHHSSHILLPQSFEHLHHSSHQPAHLHQQPPQPETHIHDQVQDHAEDPLQLIPREYTHLQDPLKEHSHIAPSSRHQDSPHQPTRIQLVSLREAEVPQPSHDTNPVHHLQLKQNHAQVQANNHQIDLIVQGQFFKTSPSSLSGQPLHHHHLPNSEDSDHNVHLQEHPNHILPDMKDCDEFDHGLQHHHGREETKNCHCHHNHHHNQQLPQHFSETEEQNDSDSHLHHHHHHHHHQQQQNPFCPPLECPIDIKIENIIS